jgi:hypothetical protein
MDVSFVNTEAKQIILYPILEEWNVHMPHITEATPASTSIECARQ